MNISTNSFANKRSSERKSVLANAIIKNNGNEIECVVKDISIGGAKVECDSLENINLPVLLLFDQFGAMAADIAWQKDKIYGLKFNGDPDQIGEMLIAIATYG